MTHSSDISFSDMVKKVTNISRYHSANNFVVGGHPQINSTVNKKTDSILGKVQ
jgi:peptidoglycan hydrolase CwlO-like protein